MSSADRNVRREEARRNNRGLCLLTRESFRKKPYVPTPPRFVNSLADEDYQQCGKSADGEHNAPSVMCPDTCIEKPSDENAKVIAGAHQTRAQLAAVLVPLLGDEGSTQVHSPPIPMPPSKRNAASCQTLVTWPEAKVKTE